MAKNWPDLFTLKNGKKVETKRDWDMRAYEILSDYQSEMYGYMRCGENVSYEIHNSGAVLVSFFGTKEAPEAMRLTIKLEKEGRSTEFDVAVFLPTSDGEARIDKSDYVKKHGCPVVICMHPIEPIKYANEHGYAVAVINSVGIASDDYNHKGCFYDIYPYGEKEQEQTGVLAAWGWGASKVLDALFAGAGRELGIDPENAIVTGVSRWGKATAVCGAFDQRFRMVAPACSGAGGLALYRYKSEGKTYDFSSKGASAEYTYGQNEPLGCLQSDAEKGWFNDKFQEYKDEEALPLEQYMLPALCADKEHLYFVIAACTGEDWVNAPSMWQCFKETAKVFEFLGVSANLACNFHKEGHAVIEEDMKYMIEYFNERVYGIKSEMDLSVLKTSVFEEEANVEKLTNNDK